VIEQLNGFGSQRQETNLATFAAYAYLSFLQQQVVAIKRQHFHGPQPLQQQQAHDCQITRGAKAGPEP
jgi:hypothetical protein